MKLLIITRTEVIKKNKFKVKEIDKNAHEEHGAVSSTGPYS